MGLPFDFFLSDVDDGLSRTSSRDPLGLEVLWTAFGRRLVPHLSTVSLGATNFAVLLVLLDCVQRYVDARGGESGLGFVDLFVAVDSLHVYAVLDDPTPRTTSRLLGRQRAARNLQEGSVLVGPGHEVLSNQLNLGLFGRYIKPLESMELIDANRLLLDDAQRVTDSLPGISTLRRVVADFLGVLDRGEPIPLSRFGEQPRLRALRERETLASFRELLLERMRVDGESTHRVRRIWKALEPVAADGVGPGTAEAILRNLEDDLAIDDACRLEWVLCRLDAMFESLFAVSRLDELQSFAGVRDVARDFATSGGEILTELVERPELSDAGRDRMEALAGVVEGPDAVSIARGLIDYHADIMAERNRAAWVGTSETGRLLVVHAGPEANKAVARWRRSYYLSSLAEFRSDLDEVADG